MEEELIEQLQRADQQRYMLLKRTIETLDVFMLPVFSAEQMDNWEELCKYLKSKYKPHETDGINPMQGNNNSPSIH